MVKEITQDAFDDAMNLVIDGADQSRCLILFYRNDCGHCQRFKPNYMKAEELTSEISPDVNYFAVNLGNNGEIMKKVQNEEAPFSIHGVPKLVSYLNGKAFSVYSPNTTGSLEERKLFRQPEDVAEFAKTIGEVDPVKVEGQ